MLSPIKTLFGLVDVLDSNCPTSNVPPDQAIKVSAPTIASASMVTYAPGFRLLTVVDDPVYDVPLILPPPNPDGCQVIVIEYVNAGPVAPVAPS